MGNFATPTNSGSGSGGGGGGGTDPLAAHTITFQGVQYSAEANEIILPTLSIPTAVSQLTNDVGFITAAQIPAIPDSTSDLINDSGFITSADVPPIPTAVSAFTNDVGYITEADLPTPPVVPTKTSQLTNDSGFLDSTDIAPVGLSGEYADLLSKPDLSALATAIQNGSSLGTGQPVFSAKNGTNLEFKTLIAGANVSLDTTTTPGSIIIASTGGGGTGSGEANTSSNSGTGEGLAQPKSGVNLPFKSLLGSAGISWSSQTDTLTVNLDATLQGLSAVVVAADQMIYATGPDTFDVAALTSYARTLLDDANAPTARATLGSSTIGDAVFTAATTVAAKQAIGITEKVPAYKQNGTILNLAVNTDGTINTTNRAGTVYKIPVVAA